MFKGQSLKKIGPLPYQVPSTKSQIYNNKETTTVPGTSNPDEPAVYVSHKSSCSLAFTLSNQGSARESKKERIVSLTWKGGRHPCYTHMEDTWRTKAGIIALNTCFIPLIPDTLHSRFRLRKGYASYDQLSYISKMSKYILRRNIYIFYLPADQL